MRRGAFGVLVAIAALVSAAPAQAGRGIAAPCRTVFCAGVSQDGSRIVFPFEEELTAGAGKRQIYEWGGGSVRPLLPPRLRYWPRLDDVSADASHVFVSTNVSLAPEDVDGYGIDVFDLTAGGANLVSSGQLGNPPGFATYTGSSPDGQDVFFEALEALVPEDVDTCPDLYRRSGGRTELVAQNPDPPARPVCDRIQFGGVSGDGSHLFFTTGAELEPGDEREDDIYQQVGSTLTRLTDYPEPEGSCVDLVRFADSSSDGGTVLFSTNVQVTPEDTDESIDVYKRKPDGTFSLVSRGTVGANGCGFDGDRPIALSADGDLAIFETRSQLSPVDRDSSNDLYSADDSGAITLLSTGPTDQSVDEHSIVFPDWLTLASDDARHVAFETRQRLVASDRDSAVDVYVHSADMSVRPQEQTELASGRAWGKRVNANAELLALSADGTVVVYATKERLVRKDVDHERDVYMRKAGWKQPMLISGERIAPRMRVAKRARRLRSGRVEVRLRCPKIETSGPCRGRLIVKRGRRGPRIGAGRFRIEAGRRGRARLRVRRRFRAHLPRAVLARVRARDALGNSRVVSAHVRLAGRR